MKKQQNTKKVRINIEIPKEMYILLKKRAKEPEQNISRLIREAIRRVWMTPPYINIPYIKSPIIPNREIEEIIKEEKK